MPEPQAKSAEQKALAEHKAKVVKGIAISGFAAVFAHTLNLQSEAILLRKACGGDLARTARAVSSGAALASALTVVASQIGGRLTDSFGRSTFYLLGPLAQITAGLMAFLKPDSAFMLVAAKVLRMIFTTFSGTVMGNTGLRDILDGQEFLKSQMSVQTVMGLAIIAGPLCEAAILKRVAVGGERITYLMLSALGLLSLFLSSQLIPETLPVEKRKPFNKAAAIEAANPFGFVQIYTKGTSTLKWLSTVVALQTTVDGKTMSDLAQIWMREHLKLSVGGIRNFIMGFGFASALAPALVVTRLSKLLSAWDFTTLTNLTNFVAFSLRGAAESIILYFGMLPLMLPGVNGQSNAALTPLVNELFVEAGFGKGESTAWLNNLRTAFQVGATLIYGYFYAWCKARGLYPGHTYVVAGLLGAALPQAILQFMVHRSEVDKLEWAMKQKTKQGAGAK